MFYRVLTLTYSTGRVETVSITGGTRREVRRASGRFVIAALDAQGVTATVLGKLDRGTVSQIVFGAIKRTK